MHADTIGQRSLMVFASLRFPSDIVASLGSRLCLLRAVSPGLEMV